ncbi:chaperone-binding protein [Sporothrix brasiliensis 5110]|uniref:Chaperone-binding protein n=1 Tax=Sporothrix brasiliensis 5110 TaxID=1398154 RepID=A0A0C2IZ48_9PEZI|nr:chaperone-binding protein [Sporothrix brasiliensis 5110]KIH94391.1 chaperone-binding protein [Sporothrix brasiliensis 5110]
MLDDLQINTDRIPLYKLILHVTQIAFSFVAWVLAIVVFRAKDSSVSGPNGWAFAVCFLSIPAWIYLIGAPRFPRTRRFAEPHVMVAIDSLYTILWLSAFAAQASFNSAGKCGDGCGASKAVVALGVFNTPSIFFGITTFLSIYSLKYYQMNGHLPGYETTGAKGGQNIDPDMAAFSTAPHDEEPYARINNMDPDYDHNDYQSDMGGYGGGSTVGGGGSSYANAGSHMDTTYLGGGGSSYGGGNVSHSDNPFDDNHGLRPAASSASIGTSAHSGYAPPTVHDAYDDTRPVHFPDANYDHH